MNKLTLLFSGKRGGGITDLTNIINGFIDNEISNEDIIEVPGVGDRPPRSIQRFTLVEVMSSRYQEIFNFVNEKILQSGFEEKIPAGIVLTGGTSKMEGVVELAESIFQTSVRIGVPENFKGMESVLKNPIYATSLGLLGYGFDQLKQGIALEQNRSLFDKAFGWLKSNY